MYFFAIDTTRRRLAWDHLLLGGAMRRSAAWMSRTARSSAPERHADLPLELGQLAARVADLLRQA